MAKLYHNIKDNLWYKEQQNGKDIPILQELQCSILLHNAIDEEAAIGEENALIIPLECSKVTSLEIVSNVQVFRMIETFGYFMISMKIPIIQISKYIMGDTIIADSLINHYESNKETEFDDRVNIIIASLLLSNNNRSGYYMFINSIYFHDIVEATDCNMLDILYSCIKLDNVNKFIMLITHYNIFQKYENIYTIMIEIISIATVYSLDVFNIITSILENKDIKYEELSRHYIQKLDSYHLNIYDLYQMAIRQILDKFGEIKNCYMILYLINNINRNNYGISEKILLSSIKYNKREIYEFAINYFEFIYIFAHQLNYEYDAYKISTPDITKIILDNDTEMFKLLISNNYMKYHIRSFLLKANNIIKKTEFIDILNENNFPIKIEICNNIDILLYVMELKKRESKYSNLLISSYIEFVHCAFRLGCNITHIDAITSYIPTNKIKRLVNDPAEMSVCSAEMSVCSAEMSVCSAEMSVCSVCPVWPVEILKYAIIFKNIDIINHILSEYQNKKIIFNKDLNLFKCFNELFLDLEYFHVIYNKLLDYNILRLNISSVFSCIKQFLYNSRNHYFIQELYKLILLYNEKNPDSKLHLSSHYGARSLFNNINSYVTCDTFILIYNYIKLIMETREVCGIANGNIYINIIKTNAFMGKEKIKFLINNKINNDFNMYSIIVEFTGLNKYEYISYDVVKLIETILENLNILYGGMPKRIIMEDMKKTINYIISITSIKQMNHDYDLFWRVIHSFYLCTHNPINNYNIFWPNIIDNGYLIEKFIDFLDLIKTNNKQVKIPKHLYGYINKKDVLNNLISRQLIIVDCNNYSVCQQVCRHPDDNLSILMKFHELGFPLSYPCIENAKKINTSKFKKINYKILLYLREHLG